MSTISSSTTFTNTNVSLFPSSFTSSLSTHFPISHLFTLSPKPFPFPFPFPCPLSISSTKPITTHLFCKSSESEENEVSPSQEEDGEEEEEADEWLQKLPEKNKPLYSHSLPCIEAWLRSLGFHQNQDDRAKWLVTNPDWHAQLSLDITDLYIRYLKSGPGNLEKDVERRFSYALSREDIENAVLGGP